MFTLIKVWLCFMICGSLMAKSIQNVSEIDSKDDSVSKKMELFELSLKNISDKILQLQTEQEEQRNRPIFFVMLSNDITLQTYSIVKFNDIVIDEGGNFNSGDGIFVAPVSGIYMFSWTIQEYTSHGAYTELRIDNVVKGTLNVYLTGSEGYDAATRTVYCKVRKGNHVWIQTRGDSGTNYFHTYGNSKSSFMGILMKQI